MFFQLARGLCCSVGFGGSLITHKILRVKEYTDNKVQVSHINPLILSTHPRIPLNRE